MKKAKHIAGIALAALGFPLFATDQIGTALLAAALFFGGVWLAGGFKEPETTPQKHTEI